MPVLESWQSVGGSPDGDVQWSTVLNTHRSAYCVLAKYATALAGLPTWTTSTSQTGSGKTETRNEGKMGVNDLEWRSSETLTNIVLRLKRAIVSENLGTRRCCVTALGTLSLQLKDPYRFDIYHFFHDILLSAHDQTCLLSDDNKHHTFHVTLGVSDLVGACLQRLDELYSAEEITRD